MDDIGKLALAIASKVDSPGEEAVKDDVSAKVYSRVQEILDIERSAQRLAKAVLQQEREEQSRKEIKRPRDDRDRDDRDSRSDEEDSRGERHRNRCGPRRNRVQRSYGSYEGECSYPPSCFGPMVVPMPCAPVVVPYRVDTVCTPNGCTVVTAPQITTCSPFGCVTAVGPPNLLGINDCGFKRWLY